jgi:anti-anti-sigma factor
MSPQTLARWFTVEQRGDVTLIRFVHASILADEVVAEIREQLFDLVEHEGRRLFVLNFSQVKSLASRMLGQLVALHKRLREVDGRLVLCQVSPFLHEFFATANLPGLLCIRGGEQDALQTFNPAG